MSQNIDELSKKFMHATRNMAYDRMSALQQKTFVPLSEQEHYARDCWLALKRAEAEEAGCAVAPAGELLHSRA